jgi:hypothetical protein
MLFVRRISHSAAVGRATPETTSEVDPVLTCPATEAMPTLGGCERWNPSGTHNRTAEEDVALSL